KEAHFDPSDDDVALGFALTESRLANCYVIVAGAETGEKHNRVLRSAEELYYDALKKWRKLRGEFSADETVALYRLAQVEHQLGRNDRAQSLYSEALEHSNKVFGVSSAYTGLLLRDYATFLWSKGDPLLAMYHKLWSWTVLAGVK